MFAFDIASQVEDIQFEMALVQDSSIDAPCTCFSGSVCYTTGGGSYASMDCEDVFDCSACGSPTQT